MNRTERRNTERKLGLLRIKTKLPYLAWTEEVRKNIEVGTRKQESMKDHRRVQENNFDNEAASKRIESIITNLMDEQGYSFTDAQEKAKEIYLNEIEGKTDKQIKNEVKTEA